MIESITVGGRLRQWGIGKYGSVKKFASVLGIVSEGLSPYLNDKRIPGNKMQARLRNLGCDVHWLMFGDTKEDVQKEWERLVAKEKEKQLTDDEYAMISELRRLKIKTTEELNLFFDTAKLNRRLNELLEDYARNAPSSKKNKGGKK